MDIGDKPIDVFMQKTCNMATEQLRAKGTPSQEHAQQGTCTRVKRGASLGLRRSCLHYALCAWRVLTRGHQRGALRAQVGLILYWRFEEATVTKQPGRGRPGAGQVALLGPGELT